MCFHKIGIMILLCRDVNWFVYFFVYRHYSIYIRDYEETIIPYMKVEIIMIAVEVLGRTISAEKVGFDGDE
jgi:hypothetical protein